MVELLAAILGTSGIIALVVFWALALGLGAAMPLMAFSAMRSLKRVSRELKRLNDTLDRGLSLTDRSSSQESGMPLWTKTGPLDIR